MKIKQVTSVYAVEENGDLAYIGCLDGWDKTENSLLGEIKYQNELKIDDEVFSIEEACTVGFDKLAEVDALFKVLETKEKKYLTAHGKILSLQKEMLIKRYGGLE